MLWIYAQFKTNPDPTHTNIKKMNNPVDVYQYRQLLKRYKTVISKTLYLAKVIKKEVPFLPQTDSPGLLFRCHRSQESHLALLRGLALIDEFYLVILPAVGLPIAQLKYKLYDPSDVLAVSSVDNKPFFKCLEETKVITMKQYRHAFQLIRDFENQLNKPVHLRALFQNRFMLMHQVVPEVYAHPVESRRRVENLTSREVVFPEFRAIYDTHIYNTFAKRLRWKKNNPDQCKFKYGGQIQNMVMDKWDRYQRGQPFDDKVIEVIDLGEEDEPVPPVVGPPVDNEQVQPNEIVEIDINVPIPENEVQLIQDNVPTPENEVPVPDDRKVIDDIVKAALDAVSGQYPIVPPEHHEYANTNPLPHIQDIDPNIPSFPQPSTPPLNDVLHTPTYCAETTNNNPQPGTSAQTPAVNPSYDPISDDE